MKFWSVFFLFCLPIMVMGQKLIKPHYGAGKPEEVEEYETVALPNGEIVPWFPIEEVRIVAYRPWKNEEERLQYYRTKRNVLRVLPYAIYAQKRYAQLDRDLAEAANKKEERRLVKECEQEIKFKIDRKSVV